MFKCKSRMCFKNTNMKLSNKVFNSVIEVVADISSESKILVGGFGLCGIPEGLIEGLRINGAR